MNIRIIFTIAFSILILSCKNEVARQTGQWYQGGTLHKSKIIDWKKASDENKLATCGDFCAAIFKDKNLDQIKIKTIYLKTCIDETVREHDVVDKSDVSEIATLCITLMEN